MPVPLLGDVIGYPASGEVVSRGTRCEARAPLAGFNLRHYCSGGSATPLRFLSRRDEVVGEEAVTTGPALVKVMTYSPFPRNLHGGDGGMASKIIAAAAGQMPIDIMGFQECNDATCTSRGAKELGGMKGDFTAVTSFPGLPRRHATVIAFRTAAFELLASGGVEVAEDRHDQHLRGASWVRLRHTASGKTVFFAKHDGPTLDNSGGLCGDEATAYKILEMISSNAHVGDRMILVGDSKEVGTLRCHIPHQFSHPHSADFSASSGNVFSACARMVNTTVTPQGGSDRSLLSAVFEL